MNDDRRVSIPDGRDNRRRQIQQEFELSHPTIGTNTCQSSDLSLRRAPRSDPDGLGHFKQDRFSSADVIYR